MKNELIERWTLEMETTNKRTIKLYGNEMRKYASWCEAHGLDFCTKGAEMAFIREMKEQEKKSTTINTHIIICRTFAKWYANNGGTNFVDGIKCVKVYEVAKVKAVDRKAIKSALKVANEMDKMIIMSGAYCGLRSCEISALNHGDLTTINGGLFIRVKGKGYSGEVSRHQPVPQCVERKFIRFFGGVDNGDDTPLFTSTSRQNKGARLSTDGVQNRIEQAFKAVGVDASSHQLRHAFALHCFEQTESVEVVRDLMGHKQASTTLRYVHEGTDKVKANVVNKIKW